MASTSAIAASLLQVGLVLGVVLLAQLLTVRHLDVESVPGVLRSRIALSNRVRPWLIVVATLMALTGLALQLG